MTIFAPVSVLLGFESRAVIAVSVAADVVTILRVLYGGQDIDTALAEPEVSC